MIIDLYFISTPSNNIVIAMKFSRKINMLISLAIRNDGCNIAT